MSKQFPEVGDVVYHTPRGAVSGSVLRVTGQLDRQPEPGKISVSVADPRASFGSQEPVPVSELRHVRSAVSGELTQENMFGATKVSEKEADAIQRTMRRIISQEKFGSRVAASPVPPMSRTVKFG